MATKKPSASRNSKLISTGLAVATGVGVVGLIGVRAAQDAQAQQSDPSQSDTAMPQEAVSSGGYTQAQLDAYAQALAQEADRLNQYRDQLAALVNEISLQQSQKTGAAKIQQPAKQKNATKPQSKSNSVPKGTAAHTPKITIIKPAPPIQQQAKPQAKSKGSG